MSTDSFVNSNLKLGWIWSFPKTDGFEKALSESVDTFSKKFGRPPEIGFAHLSAFQDEIFDFSGLKFLKSQYVLQNTVLLGIFHDSVLSDHEIDQRELSRNQEQILHVS